MKLDSKYNINQSVCFLRPLGGNGNVEVQGGIIKQINVICNARNEVEIKYIVSASPGQLEIKEEYLFREEKDVMKFFYKNMKIQLEDVEIKRKRLETQDVIDDNDDSLPF